MAKKRVTSFDVAERVGVSQPTVSRALRAHPSVNLETRQRVLEVAREMGYIADTNAARLRTGRIRAIALVILCDRDCDAASINPFYQMLLGYIATATADCGYSTIVSLQDEDRLFADFQTAGLADGAIVIGSGRHKASWDFFEDAAASGLSLVSFGSGRAPLFPVSTANVAAARQATEHLIAGGARHIVCLAPRSQSQPQFAQRVTGYEGAMTDHGLPAHVHYCDNQPDRMQLGRDCVSQLIDAGTRFDALFALCDRMAVGAMQELQRRGLSIPGDVAVCGFDGITAAAYLSPPLTTMAQDLPAIAQRLVANSIARIEEQPLDESLIAARLHARGSTAPVTTAAVA